MADPLRSKLESHQAELLTSIAAAAKAADTRTLLSLNDELRRTASLLGRMEDAGAEARAILGLGPLMTGTPGHAPQPRYLAERVAGRGHGIKIRASFLKRSADAGLELRPYRGAIYTSPAGRRIGIAVATERKPNRWFLGLGEDYFDAAVLLCAPAQGDVIDLCLAQSFILQHTKYFSRAGGQIKFNVARRDEHTILKIPTQPAERVDRFIGAILELDR